MDSRHLLGGSLRTSRILPGVGPLPLPLPRHRRHANTSKNATSETSEARKKPQAATVTSKLLEDVSDESDDISYSPPARPTTPSPTPPRKEDMIDEYRHVGADIVADADAAISCTGEQMSSESQRAGRGRGKARGTAKTSGRGRGRRGRGSSASSRARGSRERRRTAAQRKPHGLKFEEDCSPPRDNHALSESSSDESALDQRILGRRKVVARRAKKARIYDESSESETEAASTSYVQEEQERVGGNQNEFTLPASELGSLTSNQMVDELFGEEESCLDPYTAATTPVVEDSMTIAGSRLSARPIQSSISEELILKRDNQGTSKTQTNSGERSVDIDEELFGF